MGRRTLVVDDHPLTRAALVGLLEQHAFPVVGEAGGRRRGGRARTRGPARPRPPRPDDARHGRARGAAEGSRGGARLRGRRPHRVRHRGEPARRDPGGRGRLPAEDRAARADRRVPRRRRARRGRALGRGRAAPASTASARAARLDSGVPDAIADELSAREVEVLLLLDEHLGTDEIARRLYISEHTVRSHVKSLLRKLGVSSRREALEALAAARAASEGSPVSRLAPRRSPTVGDAVGDVFAGPGPMIEEHRPTPRGGGGSD